MLVVPPHFMRQHIQHTHTHTQPFVDILDVFRCGRKRKITLNAFDRKCKPNDMLYVCIQHDSEPETNNHFYKSSIGGPFLFVVQGDACESFEWIRWIKTSTPIYCFYLLTINRFWDNIYQCIERFNTFTKIFWPRKLDIILNLSACLLRLIFWFHTISVQTIKMYLHLYQIYKHVSLESISNRTSNQINPSENN